MKLPPYRSMQTVAVLLFSLVATQTIYFLLSDSGAEINRAVIWTVEAVAFLGISVFGLVSLTTGSRWRFAWAAITVGGVLNVIQVGMGLAMFPPLSQAGEAMAPAFQAVLAGAFFLYFAGKFAFGAAALLIGVDLLRSSGAPKAFGVLAALAGLTAMAVNLVAMGKGMALVFPAGLSGTVATMLLGIVVAISARREEEVAFPQTARP